MARTRMTFGVMPEREAFETAFREACPGGLLRIENNAQLERLGYGRNLQLTCDATWELVSSLVNDWNNGDRGEKAAFEASCILEALGFDWI